MPLSANCQLLNKAKGENFSQYTVNYDSSQNDKLKNKNAWQKGQTERKQLRNTTRQVAGVNVGKRSCRRCYRGSLWSKQGFPKAAQVSRNHARCNGGLAASASSFSKVQSLSLPSYLHASMGVRLPTTISHHLPGSNAEVLYPSLSLAPKMRMSSTRQSGITFTLSPRSLRPGSSRVSVVIRLAFPYVPSE